MNVLLIDDHEQFRPLIREFLEAMSGIVTEATSPTLALSIPWERFEFDLIVTDVDSTELDGFSFVEVVENAVGSQRVLFMSGTDHARRVQQKLAEFPDTVWEFVRKPFSRKVLELKITSLLARNPVSSTVGSSPLPPSGHRWP